jgi:FF domain
MPVEFNEEDIAFQLAQMQADYGGELQEEVEEEELPVSAVRQIFISVLEEKDCNPFNTWENEMPKIVGDPRYAMVKNTKERIEIFTEWARARVALIKEERANVTKEDVTPPPFPYLFGLN